MKKLCATMLSFVMLFTVTGVLSVAAEGETYSYTRNEDIISEKVFQDFEEVESMDDYLSKHMAPAPGADIYGFFSHISGGSYAMVTKENPISGEQSFRVKDFLDARKWTIEAIAEFDADAYVFETKIRIDDIPEGGQFSIKLSDVNSGEKDSENDTNPILAIKNVAGKIGLYNLTNELLMDLEVGKAYSVAIACETLSMDYYVFVDEQFVKKSEFNAEFEQLSVIRFDIRGTGTIVTLDDIVVDGCEIDKKGGTTTAPETGAPEDDATPTPAPSTGKTTPKPAPATANSAADGDAEGGFPTWAVIAIAAGAVVIIAAVVIIVVKKKK